MRSDVQQTLSALANSSSNIKRFNTTILVKPNGKDESDVNTWSRQLTNAHTIMALHALGGESPSRSTMAEGANQLAALLINGVAITPTESVNVVSETAKMPVTISNGHPYAGKGEGLVTDRFHADRHVPIRHRAGAPPQRGTGGRSPSVFPRPAPPTPPSAC